MSSGESDSGSAALSRRTLIGLLAGVATVAFFGFAYKMQQDASARRDVRDKESDSMTDYMQRANIVRGRTKK